MSGNVNIDNVEEILSQIEKLQETERGLINKLEEASSIPNSSSNDPLIQQLLKEINDIAEAREALFNSIPTTLTVLQEGVSDSRVSLVSQLTLLKVVEEQLNNIKTKISNLKNRNDTKMRLVQINTYYGKRYEYQTQLMKKIIIVCIPLIVLFVLKKKGLLPELISNYLLGITIAVGAIYIIRDMWEIHTRSNMNFDEYDWKYEDPSAYAPSIWEYNKKNFLKMDNPFKHLLKNLGICVGDSCCSDGLYFDKKKQKCIVPSSDENIQKMLNAGTGTGAGAESFTSGNGLNGSRVTKHKFEEEKDSNGVSPYGAIHSYSPLA